MAKAAGVSRATVSRVMNGRSTVAADIAERVREAAEQLSYRPSNAARNLALGRTRTVALVMPDVGNPVFQQILHGVMNAADEDGYRVLVADTAEDQTQEAAIALEARLRCDALVLVSPRMSDDDLGKLIPEVEPVVVLNRQAPPPPRADGTAPGGRQVNDVLAPSLLVDYEGAAVQVIEHLVTLGHTRLVYLAGPGASASDAQRRAGIRRALARHPHLDVQEIPAGPDIAAGHAATGAVLDGRATAAVAFNDLVAFGLLAGLNEAGVAVPADISVAGFDDIDLARYATPALTTVAVPQAELGRHAWKELAAVMDDDAQPARSARFTTELEVRASTGPVPVRPERVHVTDRAVPAGEPGQQATPADDAPAPSGTTLNWSEDQDAIVLHGPAGTPLARRESGERIPPVHAPRPYLHPVHTLGGTPLTDSGPVDHRHHYGVGMAVADVNGTSHWGGRTFIEHVGPTLLQNHGRQITSDLRPAGAALTETLAWLDEHGGRQLTEERTLTARLLEDGWALDWRSTLRATEGPLEIRSPATNGRPGAGYGGLFWRLPIADSTRVLSVAGEGETLAHGSSSPWIAFTQRHGDRPTTLVLAQPGTVRPWFVRSAEYPGACPALAWDAPLVVPAGGSVTTGLVAALFDTELDAGEAAAVAEAIV
ncbi:PmoA family protein [Myceligenerans crystallogenes]|uniref:PmoA family protein n=1 Tax=Myceligenerans crystallogenes TaxID=316335 RepID=A0ABP4ZB38_9MICO